MDPYTLDIKVWQGSTWTKTFVFSKNSLPWPDGVILGRAQIRDEFYDVKLADFSVDVITTATENTVIMTLSAENAAAIPGDIPYAKGTWDLELYRVLDGYVVKPFSGKVNIYSEATK